MKAGINRIYCNNCEEEGSEVEEPDEEEQELLKILKDIQKRVSSIPSIRKHLDTVPQSLSVLSDKYDVLVSEQERAKEKITKLEKTVLNISNKCVYLEKYNLALEQKIHDFDQSTRKQNLEIEGIE
ncbi:unnamed protein product [Arctia plantaginis]|uniref:Uncharacterized protein n=1 Tax=Arctia plantaginis TaxID=874455 RepID=A0A8S1AZQ3_ARCPL|nr:unnamed protein product [Arctia plantaginis]